MKLLRLQSAVIVFVLGLGIFGCSQKKPVLVAPQQVPTTVAPEPTPTPEKTAEQPADQPKETSQQTSAADQSAANAAVEKSKPKTTRRTVAKKPAPPASTSAEKSGTEVAKNTPNKIVVPADKSTPPQSSAGGQISPGATPADTGSQASTEQLLQSAENNLTSIKRQLTKDEEIMQAQIREFIKQSHTAITENDLARAHILAVKARLLSDELVKHQ
jgi:hypothetical protein